MNQRYRALPSVDALTTSLGGEFPDLPRARVVDAARDAIDAARDAIGASDDAPTLTAIGAAARAALAAIAEPSLRQAINASGVIIQTNLGRAPLSRAAIEAVAAVAAGFSNLEYDLERGERGSRHTHLAAPLCAICGAEAAMVVNNAAAALYLILGALASGREVLVSRGQAVEIGGGFRIPDVLRQSGATLVDVGTTNRTYPHDYAEAITERAALLLRVHSSNFRLMGFTRETTIDELVAVGRARGVPVVDDLGSGALLDTSRFGLAAEPLVQTSVAAGADLVVFSGDKLLGGPQAGIIVGRAASIDRLMRHPLARALRVDKLTIAALGATLDSYLRGRATDEIPVWQMIAATPDALRRRADALAETLGGQVVPSQGAVGGGSLPGETLPGWAVRLDAVSPDALAHALRCGAAPVVARVSDGALLLDLRSVLPEQDAALGAAVALALREAAG